MADLFDKVKTGLDKGLSAVSAKSKEVVETTKINNQIGALKDQVARLERELGEAVYGMYREGNLNDSGIKERCEALTALKGQIEAKEAELQAVRIKAGEAVGRTYCSACKAEVPEGAKFCGACGSKQGGD